MFLATWWIIGRHQVSGTAVGSHDFCIDKIAGAGTRNLAKHRRMLEQDIVIALVPLLGQSQDHL